MNKFMNKLLKTLALMILLPVGANAGPQIQHWVSDNGVRVYFVPAHDLPMLDIQIAFRAGASRDGKLPGLAQLTNTLLDDGTATHNEDEIAEIFDATGARFAISSHRDMAIVRLRSLSKTSILKSNLDNMADLLQHPSFPPKNIEREKKNMLLALRAIKESPGSTASKIFYQKIFAKHPYASPVGGNEDSVKALTQQDIMRFYSQYYVASNAVIAIVGDINRAQAETIVNQLTSKLAIGKEAPATPAVAALDKAITVEIPFPSVQTHILIGVPGIKRGDPDYFALYVGNHMLGGGGLISRISGEIREKRGLSYSAYSYFLPMFSKGPFIIGLQTRNEKKQEALDVIDELLRDYISEGPTEAELQASKQNITGGFPLRISSNKKILEYLGVIGFYELPLDYLDTFTAKVQSVTVAQIKDAFQRRVDPDKMVTVLVGGS